jgi:hypothetical protein
LLLTATNHALRSRFQIALALVLIIGATTATGCQPQGAGSITVGDPGKWRKPPVSPEKWARAKLGRAKEQTNPPVYKSIKEQIREANRRP